MDRVFVLAVFSLFYLFVCLFKFYEPTKILKSFKNSRHSYLHELSRSIGKGKFMENVVPLGDLLRISQK